MSLSKMPQSMTDVQSSPSQFCLICPNLRWHFPQTDNVPVLGRTAWDNSCLKFLFCAVAFCHSMGTVSMFSSFHFHKRSIGVLVEAVLLVLSRKLDCLLHVPFKAEYTMALCIQLCLKSNCLKQQLGQGNLELLCIV